MASLAKGLRSRFRTWMAKRECRIHGHRWNVLGGYVDDNGGTIVRPIAPTVCLRCDMWLCEDGTLSPTDPTLPRKTNQ